MDSIFKLQKKYAEFVGSKYCVLVSTGTAALHLGLLALGIKKGDEVIVPDFTMAACGFAVNYCGAKVVTVDCGADLNIDPSLIEAKITKKTKAIMVVHIYGRLANMKEILKIAKKHKLKVIEDAAEAHGAVYKSKADVTCYSFYKNKIIAGEEGGAVITNNKKIAERVAYLKNMAFDKGHTYYHQDIGFNYRMPDSMAKMILDSLNNYKKNNIKRRKIEAKYQSKNVHDAVWVIDFLAPTEAEREKIIKKHSFTRRFFKPLSTMPPFKQKVGKNALRFSRVGYYISLVGMV